MSADEGGLQQHSCRRRSAAGSLASGVDEPEDDLVVDWRVSDRDQATAVVALDSSGSATRRDLHPSSVAQMDTSDITGPPTEGLRR
jgi:hypothetical protein